MRKTAAHTHEAWKLLPSWQRLALIVVVAVAALTQLGGSSAAVGALPDQVGQWSAPSPWPIVAVHMSEEPDGRIFMLDGFEAALNSERLWDPDTNSFTQVPYG